MMRSNSIKILSLIAASIGVFATGAQAAKVCWPFDIPGPFYGFNGGSFMWNDTCQAIQATPTSGCGFFGPDAIRLEFSWPFQEIMQKTADNETGRISFDLFVNSSSFEEGNWTNGAWYQIHYVANSDGSTGWVQDPGGYVSDVYSTEIPNDHTWHFDVSFAQMGWARHDKWFQVFWTGFSACDRPLRFFISNICIDGIPELSFEKKGNNLVLTWADTDWTLQSATLTGDTFTEVVGATSPYTNALTGSQQFFRLQHK